ncbi:MAG: EAL domain-containing protein [Wenzhouxiangellaceae bacterium]|nr:EAL domain-containing protein [Wenzhouxiangellaceae bacterium]
MRGEPPSREAAAVLKRLHGWAAERRTRTLVAAMALMVVGGAVAVAWGRTLERADARNRLELANAEAVSRIESAVHEFEVLESEIDPWLERACEPETLEHFRRFLFDLEHLRDIGFVRDRMLLCSTALGVIEQPRRSSDPDFVLPDGLQVYAFRPVRVAAGRRTMVLKRPRFNALVDPSLLAGLTDSPYIDSLHISDGPDGQLFPLFEPEGGPMLAALLDEQCSAGYGFCLTAGLGAGGASRSTGWLLGTGILGAGTGLAVFLAIQTIVLRRRNPAWSLARAIRRGEFQPVYQPIVSIPDGRIVGVELLARWPEAPEAVQTPEKFVAEAEVQGLASGLTRVVVTRAAEELGAWLAEDDTRSLAINVSADELDGSGLLELLEDTLVRRGVARSQIVLELTERTVAGERERQIDVLAEHGYRVYIDDFGEGYSSLSYLHHLPVHGVKISRSFCSGLGSDSPKVDLVQAMVEIAKKRGLEVVLEGIETESQHLAAERMGPLRGQGFYYARPMPAEDLLKDAGSRD